MQADILLGPIPESIITIVAPILQSANQVMYISIPGRIKTTTFVPFFIPIFSKPLAKRLVSSSSCLKVKLEYAA